MDSIIGKVKSYSLSTKFKKDHKSEIDNVSVEMAEEAAQKLISILERHALAANMPSAVQSAVYDFDYSIPARLNDGIYYVTIFNTKSLQYPSLYPEGYPAGLLDLAMLYNEGMIAKNGVWGWDTSQTPPMRISGTTSIEGTHFIDDAISEFIGAYSDKYGIIDVSIII